MFFIQLKFKLLEIAISTIWHRQIEIKANFPGSHEFM